MRTDIPFAVASFVMAMAGTAHAQNNPNPPLSPSPIAPAPAAPAAVDPPPMPRAPVTPIPGQQPVPQPLQPQPMVPAFAPTPVTAEPASSTPAPQIAPERVPNQPAPDNQPPPLQARSETTRPFTLGLYQGFTSDDNLFRAPEGSPQKSRDYISSTGVRAGLDLPTGRQRVRAGVEANINRFRNSDQLDNTDYKANGRWDWETAGRLSGEFSAEQQKRLYRDSVDGVISTDRNMLRTSSVGFAARLGTVTRWSFELGAAASENKYSTPLLNNRDVEQTSVDAGVRWRPSDLGSLRLGLRHTEGKYPNLGASGDDFDRDAVELSGTYTVSGASLLNARLSTTKEDHSLQGQRDSDGWAGALGWNWKPTAKLSFDSTFSHDSSVGQAFFDSSLITADSSDAATTDTFSVVGTWAATAKVQVLARGSYKQRKLDNAFAAGGTGSVTAKDRTSMASLGARWQPVRAFDIGCDIGIEQRRVDGASTLTTPYKATVGSCSAQFALR